MSRTKAHGKPIKPLPQGAARESRPPRGRLRHLVVPGITLVIALTGGIPGLLKLVESLNKVSARVIFDADNSRFIPIESHMAELAGKTALILLEIRVVGAGEKSVYLAGITADVLYKGKWTSGTRLYPKVDEQADSQGISKKCITTKHKGNAGTPVVAYMHWKEFEPGHYVLGYGEPTAFSYACHYDIPGEDRRAITKLRVRINDYLGNSYQTVVETRSLMWDQLPRVVLVAD